MERQPEGSALDWAFSRAREHLATVLAGTLVVPVLGAAIGSAVGGNAVLGAVYAFALVLLVAVVYAVIVAPYEQRDALKAVLAADRTEAQRCIGNLEAANAERLRRAYRSLQFPNGECHLDRIVNAQGGIKQATLIFAIENDCDEDVEYQMIECRMEIQGYPIPVVVNDPGRYYVRAHGVRNWFITYDFPHPGHPPGEPITGNVSLTVRYGVPDGQQYEWWLPLVMVDRVMTGDVNQNTTTMMSREGELEINRPIG